MCTHYHFLQWSACPSLPPPMEGSPTLIQHWVRTLWSPIPVTLVTLLVESAAPPGLVGVMECGVGLLQLVRVNRMNFVLFAC